MDCNLASYDAEVYEKTRSGLPKTMHGNFYQTKLCLWYFLRFLNQGSEFQLSSEWDEAWKFNDLVVRCRCNGHDVITFLQAKHKREETRMFPWFSKNEFCKYFHSYLEIMKNERFKNASKWFVFCTNIDITALMGKDFKSFSSNKNDMNVKDSSQYQFGENSKFKQELAREFEAITDKELSNSRVLAETLVQNLIKSFKAANHETLVKFRKFLCEFVLEPMDDEKCLVFRNAFINKRNLEKPALTFRSHLVEALKSKNLVIENLLSCYIQTEDDYFVRKNGECKRTQIPGDQVNSKYIEDFFERFIFMVTPNQEQLDQPILIEMKKNFDSEATSKIVADLLFKELMEWLANTEGTHLNKAVGDQIIENMRRRMLAIKPVELSQETEKNLLAHMNTVGVKAELQALRQEISYVLKAFKKIKSNLP